MDENAPPQLAQLAAQAIHQAFLNYQTTFKAITRRAGPRFEACDWRGMQADALERLELYKKIVDQNVAQVQQILGGQLKERTLWSQMRSHYSDLIGCCNDFELAETFFNSITRRIFSTVGVDHKIEFIDSDFTPRPLPPGATIYHEYPVAGEPGGENDWEALVEQILQDQPFSIGYLESEQYNRLAGQQIEAHLREQPRSGRVLQVEVLTSAFYRDNGAYLIGRIVHAAADGATTYTPLAFCLRNRGQGVLLDAVLLDEDEISIVFSFTRSYFHVDVEYPHAVVGFLKSIMPLKRIAELYISIGYNKHGKTELYRNILNHLATTDDQFEIARGERGMVMAVFTMPSYDMVFKIIKDRIEPPKTTSRQEVIERYDLVFRHDRAGRLVDAQEFEHLSFERRRFSDQLLEELLQAAPNVVTVQDERVSIKHLYAERRLIPLNLYVREAPPEMTAQAVIDYGQAIKDLAATNIFPGDILLKNFGVTRHGRVVFYDYDELCLVTDCKFRRMPQASNQDDEFSAEPWFYVSPSDIFPEEFDTFLGLLEPLRSVFTSQHADLFGVKFWKNIQRSHQAGGVFDITPYPESRKINPRLTS
jgi:isocitrate dehydrogenase kinase/phosphatase